MRSARGFGASLVFLSALPVAVLGQMALGIGGSVAIHFALAVGSALLSVALFDFRAPKPVTWLGSVATGVLALVFLLQGLSDWTNDEALAKLAYRVVGQRLEGGLYDLFMLWCVVVLLTDKRVSWIPGIVAIAAALGVRAYAYGLTFQGVSLDARAPKLKLLWLAPFVWLLFESVRRPRARSARGERAR